MMRGLGRLRRWGERLGLLPPAIILAYHRVADLESDPQLLAVSPRHFAEHLEVLRRAYRPLSLRALRRRLLLNRWRPGTLVLTFDDGYADNLLQAKPLLEAAGVPATVFVTAGMLDSSREYWWDALEQVLLRTAPLPTELKLDIAGKAVHWTLGTPWASQPTASDWHVLRKDLPPDPRQALYLELADRLRPMPYAEQEALLDRLYAWAGLPRTARPSHRALTTGEVRHLADGGLIEVGAHSLTHPVLSSQSPAVQRHEITESKRRLEAVLGAPVSSLAYPFGGRDHYNSATRDLVQEAGFACACANFPGKIQIGTDPYQLPRFLVRDWNGEELARRLERWFAD